MSDQARLEQAIESAYQINKSKYGSVKNDYYGLVFMEKVIGLPRDEALTQTAFGNSDQGIDGFHFDHESNVFRIFQFKNSKNPSQIYSALQKTADKGIPSLFSNAIIPDHQPIVDAARTSLREAAPSLERVMVDFVFRGDVDTVASGGAYTALEDEVKKHSWRFEELAGREQSIPIEVRVLSFDGLRPEHPGERYSRLSQIGEVADSEIQYKEIFNESRLGLDPRKIILCYKIQFKLAMLARAIEEIGTNKYAFVHRAKELIWALICQALLNDPKLESFASEFGSDLRLPESYINLLHGIARTEVRLVLRDLVDEPKFKKMFERESYSFLRKSDTFDRAMEIAKRRYSWSPKYLR